MIIPIVANTFCRQKRINRIGAKHSVHSLKNADLEPTNTALISRLKPNQSWKEPYYVSKKQIKWDDLPPREVIHSLVSFYQSEISQVGTSGQVPNQQI